MKTNSSFTKLAFLAIFCFLALSAVAKAQTTAFTYQGRLAENATVATGIYQMEFALFDSGGTQQGSTVTNSSVSVSNGIFTVSLDFGATPFATGEIRYLEVRVKKTSEASYTTLSPRQQLLSAPYSIRSSSAATADTATTATNATTADNATTATNATTADTATNATQLGGVAASNYLQINGNGSTLTNLNASNISSGTLDNSRLSGVAFIAPSSVQSSTSTNSLLNFKLDLTGQDLGTSGTSDLLKLSAVGTYSGSAIDREWFRVDNAGGILSLGEFGKGTVPAEGSGTRFMWYPGKAAIRAGYINGTQWDDANIGNYSTAFGFGTRASGDYGFAAGFNSTAAQQGSTALGQYVTASGAASVALGYYAHTNARQGSFVFADRSVVDDGDIFTDESFRAGVNHSANWRVSGGFRIFTSSNLSTGVTIQSGVTVSNWGQTSAVISTSTGAMLTTGGVWQNASSRSLKTNFSTIDSRSILQKVLSLPIQMWSYKAEGANIRHIGAISQDFYKAFNVGNSDEGIGTVDADGVAMAAIQGLNEELKDRDKKIDEQSQQLQHQHQELQQQKKQSEQQQKQLNEQKAMIEALRKLVCKKNPKAEVCQ